MKSKLVHYLEKFFWLMFFIILNELAVTIFKGVFTLFGYVNEKLDPNFNTSIEDFFFITIRIISLIVELVLFIIFFIEHIYKR